jgi:hypothetical protein
VGPNGRAAGTREAPASVDACVSGAQAAQVSLREALRHHQGGGRRQGRGLHYGKGWWERTASNTRTLWHTLTALIRLVPTAHAERNQAEAPKLKTSTLAAYGGIAAADKFGDNAAYLASTVLYTEVHGMPIAMNIALKVTADCLRVVVTLFFAIATDYMGPNPLGGSKRGLYKLLILVGMLICGVATLTICTPPVPTGKQLLTEAAEAPGAAPPLCDGTAGDCTAVESCVRRLVADGTLPTFDGSILGSTLGSSSALTFASASAPNASVASAAPPAPPQPAASVANPFADGTLSIFLVVWCLATARTVPSLPLPTHQCPLSATVALCALQVLCVGARTPGSNLRQLRWWLTGCCCCSAVVAPWAPVLTCRG